MSNPLGPNTGLQNQQTQSGQLPQQLRQNIQQVKGVMQAFKGNPAALLQQHPMLGQIMQMSRGQNLEQMFTQMCQQRGLDPTAVLNELRN